ncbi:MAG: serine hydrolase [Gemmatimonadota bacterium]|nr:MAG: serine hydrolase [Gemmatimonadota bacterium]
MRRSIMHALLFFALLSCPTYVLAQPQSAATVELTDVAARLNGLDAFITEVMAEWKVPGLAIAVVEDGEVIVSKGYGYRDIDEELPVTARTLFAIGSITKSFTVTALGMHVDEGRLDWDEPVRTYLPDFELYDDVASERMTPRDLVTHRSGLPRHDLVWYGSDFTRQELYERLRYLEPSRDFRAAYQYQNLMFMTAGYLAGRLAGMTWEELVSGRIFEPLGMARSNFSVDESQRSDDFAYPYVQIGEDVRQVDFRNLDEIGPAGSINSSVEEMIRYVQFHIDAGKYGEEQLLSESNALQMQTPQMAIQSSIQYDELGHGAYGMGLFVGTYRGHKVVQHGGGIDGFISRLSFMPRKRVGLIVLTNLSGNNPVPTIVERGVYDRILGLDPVDWAARVREQEEEEAAAEEKAEEAGRSFQVEGTTPSHPLEDYVGSYEHAGYGVIAVQLEGAGLTASFNDATTPLEHFHYDVFSVPEDPLVPLGELKVMFRYNAKGEVDQLLVPLEPNVDDIVFMRVPDETMMQRDFLEQFEGEYDLATTVLTVELRGDDTLTLTVPGQPTYELAPSRGTTFDLKGLNGYSLEFKKDGSGAVAEVVLYQPNGTFVATRK